MNIKPPELTIFQGMPSLHIDNTKMRPEEEEAIQDQARRKKEVNFENCFCFSCNLISNYFSFKLN